MKIDGIRVFQVDLPLHEGRYSWSGGKFVDVFDCTVVEVLADDGRSGWGEGCPLGPFYLPAYAAGLRAGISELAPQLIGQDPTQLDRLNRHMDACLKGHPYVKSPLDMACWDLLGQVAGLPVSLLMGGCCGEDFVLYRAISRDTPEAMAASVAGYREQGYKRFQLKVGSDPVTDIQRIRAVSEVLAQDEILIADANTGWLAHEALRVIRGVSDLDVYVEQPCLEYEECLAVRRHCRHPFILDECVDGMSMLAKAAVDRAMDVVNIKISKFGGLTRARQARDLCLALGIGVTIEDSWGGDIITSAIAHLAHSTPPELLFTATDFNSYVTVSTASGSPKRKFGRLSATATAGLGVEGRRDVLGAPVMEF